MPLGRIIGRWAMVQDLADNSRVARKPGIKEIEKSLREENE